MKRLYAIIIAIVVVLIILLIYLFAAHKEATAPSNQISNQPQNSPSPPQFEGKEEILKNALNLYIAKKQQGVDFTNGPCLGKVADDWVLDIAHNPRIAADDKAENQCAEYRQGTAHHFIELDESGKLIRAL